MTAQFRFDTPEGSFPAFVKEVRPEFYVVTVVYYRKGLKRQKGMEGPAIIEADLHMEEGSTEAQALERLKAWCFTKFGEPCAIAKAA